METESLVAVIAYGVGSLIGAGAVIAAVFIAVVWVIGIFVDAARS